MEDENIEKHLMAYGFFEHNGKFSKQFEQFDVLVTDGKLTFSFPSITTGIYQYVETKSGNIENIMACISDFQEFFRKWIPR